jgi:hypothetical protein
LKTAGFGHTGENVVRRAYDVMVPTLLAELRLKLENETKFKIEYDCSESLNFRRDKRLQRRPLEKGEKCV